MIAPDGGAPAPRVGKSCDDPLVRPVDYVDSREGAFEWELPAIAIINRLSAVTAIAMERNQPVELWSQKQSNTAGWLIAPVVTFSDLVNASFDEIRHAAPPFPSVVVHLFGQLLTLLELSRTDEQRTVIRRQLEQLLTIDSAIVQRCRISWSQQIEAAGDVAGQRFPFMRHA